MSARTLVFGYDYLLSHLLFAGDGAQAWEKSGRKLDELLFMGALALWAAAALARVAPPPVIWAWFALAAIFPVFPRLARILAAPERVVGGYSRAAAALELPLTLALAALAALLAAASSRAFSVEPRFVAGPLAGVLGALLTRPPWLFLPALCMLVEPLWRRPVPPLRVRLQRLALFYAVLAVAWVALRAL